ncbi:hypothetical protein Ddye_002225 [Dipteronia dyeriana]|uniref:SWIM-type domain-containing protein n=1 Tax=Dipteronia dyeriana TaxID=168575 RepID=A0AAD9XQK1_9ROSI|nr:hypothetical protein Ddye_002225 [Dipteronia dyeriana]
MFTCSTMPKPSELFKAEVRLSWSGNENAAPSSSENSDDDPLSNAASFDYDLNNMVDSNSDEEEGNNIPHISKRGRPYKKTEGGRVMLEVGQLFNNLQHFRQVLRDFMVQEGFELKRIKNDKERYTTGCALDGCSWWIHASLVDDKTTFMIKTMQVRDNYQNVHKNREATTVWVARRFKPLIEENSNIDVKFLGREIHRINCLVLLAYTIYRAKNRVLNVTEEDHKRSYNNLYTYGFIVRPFVGLDGCHLKGKFPGVILSAVAIDANNGVFPVAICICETECNDSWSWFLDNLYRHIGMEDSRRITFMTNKSTKAEFMEEITKLQEVNIDAYNYIMKVSLKHWALHAFENYVKSDHLTNNISECFNVWMEKFRAQPVLSILEGVKRKIMRRMSKRLEEGRRWASNIPHLVNKKLSEIQDDSRFVSVLCASDKEFEVNDGVTFYMVNLDSKRCDCRLWELSGIPCKHALAVLTSIRQQAENFIHMYLLKDAYIRTYNNIIHPIPDQSLWPNI